MGNGRDADAAPGTRASSGKPRIGAAQTKPAMQRKHSHGRNSRNKQHRRKQQQSSSAAASLTKRAKVFTRSNSFSPPSSFCHSLSNPASLETTTQSEEELPSTQQCSLQPLNNHDNNNNHNNDGSQSSESSQTNQTNQTTPDNGEEALAVPHVARNDGARSPDEVKLLQLDCLMDLLLNTDVDSMDYCSTSNLTDAYYCLNTYVLAFHMHTQSASVHARDVEQPSCPSSLTPIPLSHTCTRMRHCSVAFVGFLSLHALLFPFLLSYLVAGSLRRMTKTLSRLI